MIKEFDKLFSGYEKAYGIYRINGHDASGKKKGFGNTIPRPITNSEWEKHLAGEQGVGIIPLRDDNTCLFGVIDVDEEFRETHEELANRINDLGLPLVVCRSESGRAHLYAFFEKPVDATIVREKLIDWAAKLKYGSSEVFPKQTYRWNDDDKGNWINIPYFGENSRRYAFSKKGKLTAEEFLEYAGSMKISPKEARAIDASDEAGGLYEFGPPCLKQLCKEGGFGEGGRNNGIFNTIVYLKKRHPDDWKDHVPEYNSGMSDPILGLDEINRIIKSHERKEYEYKCKEAPIADCCNKSVCKRQKFGIGGTGTEVRSIEIGNITKYEGDPVYWIVEVDAKRIKVTSDELLSQARFSRICMDHLNRIPKSMPQPRWISYLDERLSNLTPADIINIPEDASFRGQFLILLEDFCTLGNAGVSKEDILTGKPYWEDQKVYFRSRALINFLDKNRFKYDNHRDLYDMLKDIGGGNKQMTIMKRNTRVWFIPAPDEISEEPRSTPEFKDIDQSKEF